jgi:fermentation-respiration switch protein FrsA (DUF1100 family)
MIRIILLSLLCVMVLSCLWLQNKFTFYPDNDLTIDQAALPQYVKKRMIETSDGEKLESLHFLQKNGENNKTVLYFHGNGGNLYHRISYCQILWEMGVNVFLVSYRGYAKSTGTPSELGIYEDGATALRFVRDSLGVAENDIFIFGRSLGTAVAVNTSMNRELAGVILVTPLSSGFEMAKKMVPAISSIAKDSYDSKKKIGDVKSKLLIIHGTEDNVIPFEMGVEIFEAYQGEKKFIQIDGGGHNDLQAVDSVKYWGGIHMLLHDG